MGKLLRLEFYKMMHRKIIVITLLALLGMTVIMSSAALSRRVSKVYVYKVDFDIIGEQSKVALNMLTEDVVRQGYESRCNTYYYFEATAISLFEPEGELYDKYKKWNIPETFILMQKIDASFFSLEEENVQERWLFVKSLSDKSAALYTAIIFTVLFFGGEFSIKAYHGAIYAGIGRKRQFFCKYIAFLLTVYVLFLAELLIANFIYNSEFVNLELGYMVRAILLRCCADTGVAAVITLFPLLFRDVLKAICCSFLVLVLTYSRLAVLHLYPYRFVPAEFWNSCTDSRMSVMIVFGTIMLALASGLLSGWLFTKAELK